MPSEADLHLAFEGTVRPTFQFLKEFGFSEVESSATRIRYRKNDIELDVYLGRQSFEIGAGVAFNGNRYAVSEIIRAIDPVAANAYRNIVATTPGSVIAGLKAMGSLIFRYGIAALEGDPQYFEKLDEQRKLWSKEYALDVLAAQLRPQALDAFRRGDYGTAAALYTSIRDRLSPAEVSKLNLAEKRRDTLMKGKTSPE